MPPRARLPAPILVTGASGYIGGRLVAALERAGRPVRCLTRRPELTAGRFGADTEVVAGDVLDTAPAAFEIRFAQRVLLDQASLQLDSGDIVELTVPSPMTERATFAIPLPELRDGDYVLSWRMTVPGDRATHARVDFIVVGYHDHSEHDHSDHFH